MHPQIIRDEPGDCPICGMKLVPTSRYGYVNEPVPQAESVLVPRSALLMAGEHSVVYVETEPGRFELRNVTLGPILRNQAIILEGVKPGEQVATSGNFLIDSQMQLAGKPSLIDPTRFASKAKQDFRNTPLQFDAINVVKVEGATGEKLEQLYQVYFEIQQTLAADKQPTAAAAESLASLSGQLAENDPSTSRFRQLLVEVKEKSAHLHHLSLDDARRKFKPISHAVVSVGDEEFEATKQIKPSITSSAQWSSKGRVIGCKWTTN